jgi:glycosyltransferase involved in cell wall biosynthesis
MDITVLICTCNRASSLKQTLASLWALEMPPSLAWEVVVVDNHSTDSTRSVIEEFSAISGLNVRYVVETQRGKSHALNAGVREAKGEIIALTDDDVRVATDWLVELKRAFDQFRPACVSGRVLLHPDLRLPAWWDRRWKGVLAHCDLGDAVIRSDSSSVNVYEYGYGANLGFHRRVLEKYGPFRTDLGPGKIGVGEDTEYVLRLYLNGELIIYYPNAVVYHLPDVAHLSKKYLRRWYYHNGVVLQRLDLIRFQSSRRIGHVPVWRWRWAAETLRSAVVNLLTGGLREVFSQELRVIRLVGYGVEALKTQFHVARAAKS